jgi:PAS domain S-box-containing protein
LTPPAERDQLNTTSSSIDRRKVERLAALEYLRAVRPGVDHVLQELVDEVRGVYGTDLCMINLNLTDMQYFRAWSGELDPDLAEARQDALEHSMCQYVVNDERPLVVNDFLATEEFREQHWYVNYGIRFYAGTPLVTSGGHAIGTLCLLSTRSVEFSEEQMKVLGAFARAVVGRLELLGALEREQAAKEEEAQRSLELQQTLDSLSAHIAILDESGEIIAVNGVWRAFAEANGGDPRWVSEGANYLRVCESAADLNAEEAAAFAEGVRAVLSGRRESFEMEYPCHSPTERRWFMGRVTPFFSKEKPWAVVAHENITERKLAEERMHESEWQFRALFENTLDAILVANDAGEYVEANDAACDLFGVSLEGLLGARLEDFVEPAERHQTRLAWQSFLEQGEQEGEFTLYRPDGEMRDLEFKARAGFLPGRHLSVLRDVSERKRAEEALHESEERYRKLFDSIDEGFGIIEMLYDRQGRAVDYHILETNPAFGRMTGFADAAGKTSLELNPDAEPYWFETLGKVAETGEDVRFESYAEALDQWFDVYASRVGGEGSRRVAIVFANTTERKLAEEALQDQKVLLETILGQAADAIIVCDDEGRFTFANAAARQMALQDPEGTTLDRIPEVWGVAHYPDGRRIPREEWSIPRALRGETTVGRDTRMVRPDGSYYDVLISAAPLNNADGELVGAVAGLLDITERKRLEEEQVSLRQRELESRTQREERRRIARDLHDIVLQDLSGALQSLRLTHLRTKGSGVGLELEEELEALRRATTGLRSAIYDLRHEKGRPFVKSVESLVGLNRQLSPERKIELIVEEGFPEELGGEVGVQLVRVLQEALANARRHSGAKSVEVRLRKGGGGEEVLAEVADDGRGFDRGTIRAGVGLSAMRERVEALGGKIEVRSRAREGTQVRVRVPWGDGTPAPRRL